ncbi:MAG TPA: hypothetical protein VEX41_05310, partial [Candidatus Eisenbacteria bacterium]|nr:hypothetical protein [Candidatus Eisenbacteria bacterium]
MALRTMSITARRLARARPEAPVTVDSSGNGGIPRELERRTIPSEPRQVRGIVLVRCGPTGPAFLFADPFPRNLMARSCAICGKVSMGGFNPQSSGSNRVRAHRRMQPNLQPTVIDIGGVPTKTLVCT